MINRPPELAPCGVYCGACPSYGKSCKGCSAEDIKQQRKTKWYCKIRTCCYEKGLDFCIYCEEFPCKIIQKKLLSTHHNDPRYTYRFEIPAIFPKLKDMTISEYLEFQKQRWLCNGCGELIHFYHYKCSHCGKEKLVQ